MPDEVWIPNFNCKGKTHVKQLEIFNCFQRYLLVCGPRRSGKTRGVIHKVVRHLWEVPGARVALITKTNKLGKEGGVWQDLIELIIPEWINSNIIGQTQLPFEYVSESKGIPGPRMDAATRTSSFRIRNYYGGESELIHLSLDNDEEVETKYKSTNYSLVWVSELSEFKTLKVFTTLIQQLRVGKWETQQFIGDTNPASEGEDSWIFNAWYVRARQKEAPEDFLRGVSVQNELLKDTSLMQDPQTAWDLYRQDFRLIEVFLQDNPFLGQRELAELIGSNVDMNPGEYDRNVLGKWSKGFGHKGKLFSDVIIESIHFIGPAIDVHSSTGKLYCGWDLGSVNHAFAILELVYVEDKPIWRVIDEVVTIDEKISIESFTFQCLDKMLKLETHYKRPFEFIHWSDDSALNMFRPGSNDGYDAAVVNRVSNGLITLMAADKPRASVGTGIAMIRKAIRESRFYVGNNCPKIQEMLLEISEGKTKEVDDSEYKHPFDAVRYPIYMELRMKEAVFSPKPETSNRSAIMSV